MSKIVKAVNVMVSNPSQINEVYKGEHETEVFFQYAEKYKWSILKNKDDVYFLSYFTEEVDLKDLALIPNEIWMEVAPSCISYNTKELATREARDSFAELYALVSEKAYGMDEVLDEIIASDELPF